MRLRKGTILTKLVAGAEEPMVSDSCLREDNESVGVETGLCGGVGKVTEGSDGGNTGKENAGQEKQAVEDDTVKELLQGRGGDGITTEVDREVEKGQVPDEVVEMNDSASRRVTLDGVVLTPRVGGRKALKRCRLRAWRKYFKTKKAKLSSGDVNGNLDLKIGQLPSTAAIYPSIGSI